jgi:hypothetical protein
VGEIVGGPYSQKTAPVAADVVPIIDSEDLTYGADGTNKWATFASLLAAIGALALPSGGTYPSSVTEFLRGDGAWAVPPGTGGGGTSYNTVSLNDHGADRTGATFSDTAMASAISALTSLGGGVITCEAGTYKFANSYTTYFGVGYGIATGNANESVIFKYTGTGTFIYSGDPSFNTSNTSPLVSVCGPMTGFTVDGTSAGSASVLFQCGDQNSINVNIGVQNQTGATSVGAYIAPKVGWINYGSIVISSDNCLDPVVFDGGIVGSVALGGINYTFYQTANQNQNGIVVKRSCQVVGGTWNLFGEYLGGSGTNTGAVISIDSTSQIINFSEFNVNAESNTGAGNVGHVTVALATGGAFFSNFGNLVFRNPFSCTFQVSTGLSASQYFTFFGFVICQTSGDFLGNPYAGVGTVGWASITKGASLEQLGVVDSSYFYVFTGSVYNFSPTTGANTRGMYGSAPTYAQKITLFITQPTGGATVTLTAGYVDVVELRYNGTSWAVASTSLHVH